MELDKKTELQKWQKELECKRDDILRKRQMIKEKIDKVNLKLEIANTLRADEKNIVTEQLSEQLYKYERELADYNETNDPQVRELNALIMEVTKRLGRL